MRNFSTPAIILNVQPLGENNRSVTLFTPEDGISYSTLYGGPKSKLRSLVSPMNAGIIYIYRDESKKSSKITDFDVKKYHLSFRESLFKIWASSLVAELLIKTHCAGSPSNAWTIVNGFLDGMELTDESESKIGLIRFLWRYLGLLGIRPNTRECVHCGESFMSERFAAETVAQKYRYYEMENGFICSSCSDFSSEGGVENQFAGRAFFLGKSSITYLEAISTLSPKDVRQIVIDEKTFLEMKQLCFYLIEQACGSRLKSLESGIGIL